MQRITSLRKGNTNRVKDKESLPKKVTRQISIRRSIMSRQKAGKGKSTFFLFCFVMIAAFVFANTARSEYPERNITILVGMEAGGLTDIITRALVVGASRSLKQPIIIENRGGGGGSIAGGLVATANPDGYTLAAIQNNTVVDFALMNKVPFKPLRSFTPVTAFAWSEHSALLVDKDAPWKTFEEFARYAKQNPGKIKWSVSGLGTGMHVAMEVIAKRDGIKWVAIPHKGGPGARTALLGKHVDACSYGSDWPAFVPAQLDVLATHGKSRSPHSPNVPTLSELGYDFISTAYHSIVGPAGLPPEVVAKLEAAFLAGMGTPEFKTARERLYLSAVYYNGNDYKRSIEERWVAMEKLFKEVGIIKEPATPPY
jgi:tripartite-type tricarboxylate transporter receptor subunit TctC